MIAGNGRPWTANDYGRRISSRIDREESLTAEDVKTFVERLDQWIERHPGLCIAAALTTGVALGWLIKRR